MLLMGERGSLSILFLSSLLDNPKGYGGRREPKESPKARGQGLNNQPNKRITCRQMDNKEEWAFIDGHGSVIYCKSTHIGVE